MTNKIEVTRTGDEKYVTWDWNAKCNAVELCEMWECYS